MINIKELLEQMTIDEKIGQLVQYNANVMKYNYIVLVERSTMVSYSFCVWNKYGNKMEVKWIKHG